MAEPLDMPKIIEALTLRFDGLTVDEIIERGTPEQFSKLCDWVKANEKTLHALESLQASMRLVYTPDGRVRHELTRRRRARQ